MIFEIHPSPLTLLPLGYLMSAFQHSVHTSKQHKLLPSYGRYSKKTKRHVIIFLSGYKKKYIFRVT